MQVHRSEMKQWAKQHLRGIENCTFPSFTPDLQELDEEGIRHDIRQAVKHGFVSTLLTLEAGVTFEEAKRFVTIATDEAKDKVGVGVTLIFNSIEQNIAMAQHAAKAGAHTALLGYPFTFYPQTPEEIYEVSKRVCDAAPDLAIVLYPSHKFNFGRFHPCGFPLDILERIADIENVVSCKFGLLEPGFIGEAFDRLGDKVVVQFPWERWWPMLTKHFKLQFAGAGAYELMQSPEKPYVTNMFKLLLEGKRDEALEIYWRLTPARLVFEKQFMPTQMIGTYHWPQQKYYQWLVGGNGGYTRQPCMKMVQYEMEEARGALRAIGINPSENDAEFFVGRVQYAKGKRL